MKLDEIGTTIDNQHFVSETNSGWNLSINDNNESLEVYNMVKGLDLYGAKKMLIKHPKGFSKAWYNAYQNTVKTTKKLKVDGKEIQVRNPRLFISHDDRMCYEAEVNF